MNQYSRIKQQIISRYAQKDVLLPYIKKATDGLWPSEQKLINRFFTRKNANILDIGCGAGRETVPLVKMGFRVVAIDISPEMLKEAKKFAGKSKIKAQFIEMDATNLRFKSNSFDYIFFPNNIFEQIPGNKNRFKALCEAHRVLKKGGIFMFTTHSRFAPGLLSINIARLLEKWIIFNMKKLCGIKQEILEFGDEIIPDRGKLYVHFSNPFKVKKRIEKAGFELVYINSRERIEKSKEPAFNMYFQEPIFYVCAKQ